MGYLSDIVIPASDPAQMAGIALLQRYGTMIKVALL